MKKEKSLKELQAELLRLVKEKYYENDEEIANCINSIDTKIERLKVSKAKRDEKKENVITQVVKNVASKISKATLLICHKLILKEKVSNQIMGYQNSAELDVAEVEITASLLDTKE